MNKQAFVFDLTNEAHVASLAQDLAWQIPGLVSAVEDIDEAVISDALEAVISDIAKAEMEKS